MADFPIPFVLIEPDNTRVRWGGVVSVGEKYYKSELDIGSSAEAFKGSTASKRCVSLPVFNRLSYNYGKLQPSYS